MAASDDQKKDTTVELDSFVLTVEFADGTSKSTVLPWVYFPLSTTTVEGATDRAVTLQSSTWGGTYYGSLGWYLQSIFDVTAATGSYFALYVDDVSSTQGMSTKVISQSDGVKVVLWKETTYEVKKANEVSKCHPCHPDHPVAKLMEKIKSSKAA